MSRTTESRKPRWQWLTHWLKICVALLAALILLRAIGLEIQLEIELGEEPLLASLNELETWILPLGLVLIYLLLAWLWERFFGSRED